METTFQDQCKLAIQYNDPKPRKLKGYQRPELMDNDSLQLIFHEAIILSTRWWFERGTRPARLSPSCSAFLAACCCSATFVSDSSVSANHDMTYDKGWISKRDPFMLLFLLIVR